MYKVIGTDTYLEEVARLPRAERYAAEKIPRHLTENPFLGRPLSYPFLREKRIREKRVYYLIYEDLQLVLLIAISGKKEQQFTIDHIKENLKEYRKVAEEISKRVS